MTLSLEPASLGVVPKNDVDRIYPASGKKVEFFHWPFYFLKMNIEHIVLWLAS
jgi:hypothetical protein